MHADGQVPSLPRLFWALPGPIWEVGPLRLHPFSCEPNVLDACIANINTKLHLQIHISKPAQICHVCPISYKDAVERPMDHVWALHMELIPLASGSLRYRGWLLAYLFMLFECWASFSSAFPRRPGRDHGGQTSHSSFVFLCLIILMPLVHTWV